MNIFQKFQKKQFALFTKKGDETPKSPVTKYIPEFFAELSGSVLEVGAGAGVNLSFYPRNINLIALEPNPFMREYFQEKAEALGFKNVKIIDAEIENILLPEGSVDFVVSTHVFCSVKNPLTALREVLRVLKPGGKFLFWEHVRGEDRGTQILQSLFNPVNKILYCGCQINRDTLLSIQEAGFGEVQSEPYSTGSNFLYRLIEPHIGGFARK